MKNINRYLKGLKNSYFLFGPRGTGKTIWTRLQYPDALTIDLLNANESFEYLTSPNKLADVVKGHVAINKTAAFTVIIDEIQKVPQLLDIVHGLIVDYPQVQFVMTGSSARKIRRDGVNLLGGRAGLCYMNPYMASEVGDLFDFKEALKIGMLPVVWGANSKEEAIKGYVGMYLSEEVKQEALVRKLAHFAHFLKAASFSHGAILNKASVARECGVNAPTVAGFFQVLEDLMLCYQIPVFSKRAKRELIASSKFYYFDVGIYRQLRPKSVLDMPESIEGMALEGFICQHLKAWCNYTSHQNELYYWRTKAGVEVDFVLFGDSSFYAIEVKNSDKVRPEDLRGLRSFSEDYPEAKCYLLYRGSEILEKEGILCLPCEFFLKKLRPNSWVDTLF